MIYAYEDDGRKIHILDAEQGMYYSCSYCNAAVMPKQGPKMPWHFYHMDSDDAESCSFPSNIGCILHIRERPPICEAGQSCEQDCQFRR